MLLKIINSAVNTTKELDSCNFWYLNVSYLDILLIAGISVSSPSIQWQCALHATCFRAKNQQRLLQKLLGNALFFFMYTILLPLL